MSGAGFIVRAGLCYWPGCAEPLFQYENGEPYLIVQIAHIRAVYRGAL